MDSRTRSFMTRMAQALEAIALVEMEKIDPSSGFNSAERSAIVRRCKEIRARILAIDLASDDE